MMLARHLASAILALASISAEASEADHLINVAGEYVALARSCGYEHHAQHVASIAQIVSLKLGTDQGDLFLRRVEMEANRRRGIPCDLQSLSDRYSAMGEESQRITTP